MKQIALILCLSLIIVSCKNEEKKVIDQVEEMEMSEPMAYASFGMEINDDGIVESSEIMEAYKTMKVGDSMQVKTVGTIKEVCSKKGCWMKLDMGNEQIVRVTFKDYGFFMPLDATGDVIINGKAYVAETSVDDLRHYAEDAGKSAEEIAAITEPEKTYGFLADGVLLKN